MSRIHVLERCQRIELPIERIFALYGDALDLERFTPPWLGFEVTTPGSIEMGVGTLIEYRLRRRQHPPVEKPAPVALDVRALQCVRRP